MISNDYLENGLSDPIFKKIEPDQAKDAMIIIQGEKIVDANPLACQLLTGNEHIQLKDMYLSLFIDQSDFANLFKDLQAHFLESDPQPMTIRIISKGQNAVPVTVIMHPVKSNEQLFILLTLRKTEKTGTGTAKQQERLVQLGQLSAQMLHEIRNPLTAIKGFVQLIQHNPSAIDAYLPVVLNEISYIEDISADLLSLTKPRQKSFSESDLLEIARNSLLLFAEKARKNKIILELNTDNPSHMISGNRTQLKQVFINLIKNAIEATPEKGRITLTFCKREKEEEVTIRDTGSGMAQETLQRIGTPFFTTKEKGTGLGLAICYQIIHAHHGRITVNTTPQSGTQFTLTFPSILP